MGEWVYERMEIHTWNKPSKWSAIFVLHFTHTFCTALAAWEATDGIFRPSRMNWSTVSVTWGNGNLSEWGNGGVGNEICT